MSGIIHFLGRIGDSGAKKMLITQKKFKKCIKSFDTIKKLDYNANV